MKKRLKFDPKLIPLVLSGEKTSTWRLFDDKDLQAGDIVEFTDRQSGKQFASAKLLVVRENTLGSLEKNDLVGHEQFSSKRAMYHTYKHYYNKPVTAKTQVKLVRFELINEPMASSQNPSPAASS